MKYFVNKLPLYVTLGIIIITMVTIIMSIGSTYTYLKVKDEIFNEMKKNSRSTIVSLQKNVSKLIASYSVNEYENLLASEMGRYPYYAIVITDYNMGKILGQKSFLSGKIRSDKWEVLDFDETNAKQRKSLESVFYFDAGNFLDDNGKLIGSISIYNSDHSFNEELNKIIVSTIVNSIFISLLLIFSLLITIHLFILNPISSIISIIKDSDDSGIPNALIPSSGSTEIATLSKTMNGMISSISESRIKLLEQHEELINRKDELKILSMATEQSPVSILICNQENIIEYANPQFELTSGYGVNDIVGCTIEFLFQSSERDKKILESLSQALSIGEKWIHEITPLTKNGEVYTYRISATSIFNDNESVLHHVFVAEDITELKRNEEILRNSQKMDAVGQLTGGIAHDFNNLLGIIIGNLELLKFKLVDQPKELQRVENALAGAIRGSKLTRKLLNFSRQDLKNLEIIKVNPIIENLYELIDKSVTAAINVETKLDKNLWPVEVDSGDLEDAILNLSLNARDAMPDSGYLVIETENKYLDEKFVEDNPSISVGDYVMISVSDSGSGINKHDLKKIFDPFFSTKEVGKGTGLGLSMVYGFVQRSKGLIQIYTEEGNGTVFHIYLPRIKEDSNSKTYYDKSHYELHELPHGNEKILIVDDELSLSSTAVDYLQLLGYSTLVAASGEEALELLENTQGVDLLFTDVVMPGMDGFKLASTAVASHPELNVLMTSGFTSKRMQHSNHQEFELNLSKNLLSKPYNLSELAFAVDNILHKERNKITS